jgi:hypothetical protein
MPTVLVKDVGQRANTGAILEAVMGQADQSVAVRVAAGEQ